MDWSELSEELDAWHDEGRIASLWWRDDDAAKPAPALDRLVGLAIEHSVRVGLAVIPALAHPSLGPWLDTVPVEVLQHGWAHLNHAGPDEKKSELGRHRPAGVVMDELSRGLEVLRELAGSRFQPVLIPPWNRIDDALIPALPDSGFRGLSTYGPRRTAEPLAGVSQANCHIDVVDWRGTRGFVGHERAIAAAVAHLRARRACSVDPTEPTGLLTHHAVHDESTWEFIDRYLERTRQHPAAHWLTPRETILG